jgi:hypothetical protein
MEYVHMTKRAAPSINGSCDHVGVGAATVGAHAEASLHLMGWSVTVLPLIPQTHFIMFTCCTSSSCDRPAKSSNKKAGFELPPHAPAVLRNRTVRLMQLDGARVSPALLNQLSEGYSYSIISGHGSTAGRRVAPFVVPAQAASSVDALNVESAESEPENFCLCFSTGFFICFHAPQFLLQCGRFPLPGWSLSSLPYSSTVMVAEPAAGAAVCCRTSDEADVHAF